MIQFQNVTKLYKTVIGVNDISLLLKPGAYGLLGPNGSGKTTLINLIIGQLRPTLGRVQTFGQSPWRHGDLLRRIGLCPALEVSYPNVSGLEWVAHLVCLQGFDRRHARLLAENSLEQVGMTHSMRRAMGEYSLGMRQRCKLAQAIAHDPELLILDEPFNGLDPIGRFEMTAYLRQWIASGKSLILASHILHEVEAVKPSLLLISGGRLLASGSPEEVRSIIADCPNAIFLKSNHAHRLAGLAVQLPDVEAVNFDHENQGIVITTRSPLELYRRLPEITESEGIEITEIRSADDSLQDIFSTLMRIHRGEISAA